jgi:hypothetical protein
MEVDPGQLRACSQHGSIEQKNPACSTVIEHRVTGQAHPSNAKVKSVQVRYEGLVRRIRNTHGPTATFCQCSNAIL